MHGGPEARQHCLIDDSVLRQLEGRHRLRAAAYSAALAVIRFARSIFPDIPQVGLFRHGLSRRPAGCRRVLPIPKELRSEGIQRYGFHGLSCELIVRHLADDCPTA